MDKAEIKRGMKMARQTADERYVMRSEYSSGTTVTTAASGLQLAIGDKQPVNKSVWLDTSNYASVNGAIATYSPTESEGNVKFVVSDTEPTDTSVAWINTSAIRR